MYGEVHAGRAKKYLFLVFDLFWYAALMLALLAMVVNVWDLSVREHPIYPHCGMPSKMCTEEEVRIYLNRNIPLIVLVLSYGLFSFTARCRNWNGLIKIERIAVTLLIIFAAIYSV